MPTVASKLAAAIGFAVMLTGCATHYAPGSAADPSGFFSGFWHGLVFPLALVANLVSWFLSLAGISFLDSIQLVSRPNTGFGYYCGFVLGLAATSGGGSSARTAAR